MAWQGPGSDSPWVHQSAKQMNCFICELWWRPQSCFASTQNREGRAAKIFCDGKKLFVATNFCRAYSLVAEHSIRIAETAVQFRLGPQLDLPFLLTYNTSMKIFIVIIHVVLGLLLVFYGYNTVVSINSRVNNPNNTWSAEYVTNLKSTLPNEVTKGIAEFIFGVVSLVGAFSFKKDKPWTVYILPLVTLALSFWIIFPLSQYNQDTGENWGLGGIQIMVGLVVFVIFILESGYMIFRRRKSVQPS